MIYGSSLVKWRIGFIVWIDKSKFPSISSGNYPYGFFGLIGPLAIQYDFTEIN